MNFVQYYVQVERYVAWDKRPNYKANYERMAIDSDVADEQFGKYFSHLFDIYVTNGGGQYVKRDVFGVANVQAHMKVYTLMEGNKVLASISLTPVLTSEGVVIKEYEQGDL